MKPLACPVECWPVAYLLLLISCQSCASATVLRPGSFSGKSAGSLCSAGCLSCKATWIDFRRSFTCDVCDPHPTHWFTLSSGSRSCECKPGSGWVRQVGKPKEEPRWCSRVRNHQQHSHFTGRRLHQALLDDAHSDAPQLPAQGSGQLEAEDTRDGLSTSAANDTPLLVNESYAVPPLNLTSVADPAAASLPAFVPQLPPPQLPPPEQQQQQQQAPLPQATPGSAEQAPSTLSSIELGTVTPDKNVTATNRSRRRGSSRRKSPQIRRHSSATASLQQRKQLQGAAAGKRQEARKKLQRRHSAKLKAGRAAAAAAAVTRRQQAAARLGAQAAVASSLQPAASNSPLKTPAATTTTTSSSAAGARARLAAATRTKNAHRSKWVAAPPAVKKATLSTEAATAKTRAALALDQAKARVASKAAARKAARGTRRREQSQLVATAKQQRQAGRAAHAAHARGWRHQRKPPNPPPYDDSSVLWLPCSPCPPGHVSPGGPLDQAYCRPCPVGQVPNADRSTCVPLWPAPTPPTPPKPPPPPTPPTPPKPPSPPRPIPVRARNVDAFAMAPAAVWVNFQVQGSDTPLVIGVVPGSGPRNGTLGPIDQKGQRVRYTPHPTYCSLAGKADPFNYTVTDSKGRVATARAFVFIDCPDAVTTEDQYVTTEIATSVDIVAPIVGGAQPYSVNITAQPTGGTITASLLSPFDVTFTYQPFGNYCSIDGFSDYFEFEIRERFGSTALGMVEVTVLCPSPPAIMAPDLTLDMQPGGVLDVDLQIDGSAPLKFSLIGLPLNGNLTNISSTGRTSYKPDSGYCSLYDFTDGFFYTVYDAFGQYVDGSVNINVRCPDPPSAETQYFETPAQISLLQNLTVNSSAPLKFDISQYPSYGIVNEIDANGQALYTPDYDFCSLQDLLDNWGYDVEDIYGQNTFGLVFVKVLCPPPPKPKDTVFRFVAQYGAVFNLTLPVEGGLQPFDAWVTEDPLNGYVGGLELDASGSSVATTYTPVEGYCNTDPTIAEPWNWVVYDPFGQFGEASCTLYFACPDPPSARDQFAVMNAGESKLIRLQVSSAPPLEWVVYSPPLGGDLSNVSPNNTIWYTPNQNFCSLDGFPDTAFFTISDPFSQVADGSLTITVNCPPPPEVRDLDATILQSQSSINIKPVVQPPKGNYIFAVDEHPTAGTAAWNDTQQAFVYTPNSVPCALQSSDQFLFVVSDVYGQPPSYGTVTVYCSVG